VLEYRRGLVGTLVGVAFLPVSFALRAFDAMHPREREERYGSPVVLIAAAECVGLDTTFPSAVLSGVRVVVTPVDSSGRLLGKDRAAAVGKGEADDGGADGGAGDGDPDGGAAIDPDHRITFSTVFCFSEVGGWVAGRVGRAGPS
jgi:hypothetical protein